MPVLSGDKFLVQWVLGSARDWQITTACERCEFQRIFEALRRLHISGNYCKCFDLQFRRIQSEKDRHRIIDARVGINDDALRGLGNGMYERADEHKKNRQRNASLHVERSSVWVWSARTLQQHTGNGGRHEVRHRAGEHRAETKPRQLTTFVRSQRPDAADLNSDGTEISKTAEREGCDCKRARIERSPLRTEPGEGHEFVKYHPCTQQIAHRRAIAPGNPNQPRDRCEQHSENAFQARGEPSNMVVNTAQTAVNESDQREKCD